MAGASVGRDGIVKGRGACGDGGGGGGAWASRPRRPGASWCIIIIYVLLLCFPGLNRINIFFYIYFYYDEQNFT